MPGFASPIGLRGCLVIVDDLIPESKNLVSGANEENYHMMNVNYGRDYEAEVVADIAMAYEQAPCKECGSPLQLRRGVEVGNIFKLGTRYSESVGCQGLPSSGPR